MFWFSDTATWCQMLQIYLPYIEKGNIESVIFKLKNWVSHLSKSHEKYMPATFLFEAFGIFMFFCLRS